MANATGTDLLFVYGTLRSRAGTPLGRFQRSRLARETSLLGLATVAGRLLDLGAYPALELDEMADAEPVPDGKERQTGLVYGEVLRMLHPPRTLRWLDEYEGTGQLLPVPQNLGYRRQIVTAILQGDGLRAGCWAYTTDRKATAFPQIASGCWLQQCGQDRS